MHQEWHAWEPGDLQRLNRALAAGQAVRTTPDILELISRSQEMERLSGGRFNPASGKLVSAWGFHTSEFPITTPPPHEADIQALVETAPSSLDIEIDGNVVTSSNRQVQLDFGGIAKGHAVDLALEMIKRRGQSEAIVNAGGDVRVLGSNLGKPWRIGVRDPTGGIAGAIELEGDWAVFTSGNYERFRLDGEVRRPHILDPHSGWPVSEVSSATAIAEDGATADAAATALVVAGPDDWADVAAEMGVKAALVIDGAGRMRATRSMMNFFTPAPGRDVTFIDPD
jgi:thiamine biosynthesis lipoprotein